MNNTSINEYGIFQLFVISLLAGYDLLIILDTQYSVNYDKTMYWIYPQTDEYALFFILFGL